MKIRIGTRKSALALAQVELVKAKLLAAWPDLAVEVVSIITSGDMFTDQPLTDIGGKGLFTKEIEEALLDKRVDIAVHSMKDMQTILPDGLTIGCMLEREDPRDMLVGEGIGSIADIPQGATFGTASLRRSSQILIKRPDLKIVPLRGNVQTRLDKLARGDMRATMLAVAGLKRLGLFNPPPLRGREGWGVKQTPSELESPPTLTLPLKGGGDICATPLATSEFLPAIAQGAIGIECRTGDEAIMKLLAPLSHAPTEIAVRCERAFLRVLDGSCRTPIAGLAEIHGDHMHFYGLIARPDGSKHYTIETQGTISDAEELGTEAGKELLAKAGKNFL